MPHLHPDKQLSVKAALQRRARRRMKTDPNTPSLVEALAVEVYNEAARGKGKKVDLVKGGTSADRAKARAAVQTSGGAPGPMVTEAQDRASRSGDVLASPWASQMSPTAKWVTVGQARERAAAGKDLVRGGTAADRTRARKASGVSTRAQRYRKAAAAGGGISRGTPAGTN